MFAACLASSCVGETGDDSIGVFDKALTAMGVPDDRPVILELLLDRRSGGGGEVRAVLMANGCFRASVAGD